MKIGIAGPVSLKLLADYVKNGDMLPNGYLFPPMADWIKEIVRRGHEVSLFTLAPEINSPLFFEGEQLKIFVGRYRHRGRARALDLFAIERDDLLKSMEASSVEILHSHWTYEFSLAALDSKIPTLVTARDAPWKILKLFPDPYRLVRLLMAYQVCRRAPRMTVASPYLEVYYRKVMGYRGRLETIPNGFPDNIFELGQTRIKREQTHIVKNKVVFYSVMTGWGKLKNGQPLIQAFSKVHLDFPQFELWMFGKGYGPGEEAQIWGKAHGFSDGICFIGQTQYLNMLTQLAENVDVLVHPSLEESFSNAVAEAMALGLPVIGGKKSGAVPYTLGKGGILVDVRSIEEIAQAMLLLGKDAELRNRFGRIGNQLARERYTLNNVTSQYENIYQQILRSV